MQKNILPKVGTIIPPIMLAGSIITSNFQQNLIDKLLHEPGEAKEQHFEEFPSSDSFGLTRDSRTAIVSGTNRVAVFGNDNSNEIILRSLCTYQI